MKGGFKMGLLDLKQKEMELALRLYLNRCDRKPLIWWYYDNGTGLKVKAIHEEKVKTITLVDLVSFFSRQPKVVQDKENLIVVYQNSPEMNENRF